jgi:hypothetical protein
MERFGTTTAICRSTAASRDASMNRTEKGKDFKVFPSLCMASNSFELVSFSSFEKVKRIKKARRGAGLVN